MVEAIGAGIYLEDRAYACIGAGAAVGALQVFTGASRRGTSCGEKSQNVRIECAPGLHSTPFDVRGEAIWTACQRISMEATTRPTSWKAQPTLGDVAPELSEFRYRSVRHGPLHHRPSSSTPKSGIDSPVTRPTSASGTRVPLASCRSCRTASVRCSIPRR
jgi:hypothetical protein